MTTKEFLILSECTKDDIEAKISRLQRPSSVGGRSVPETLNGLNMGEILRLQTIRTDKDAMFVPCEVILKMSDAEVMEAEAWEVFGFMNWVATEMRRINGLFERAHVPPTKEEKEAGVEQLNFGAFGLLDWYARRMGMTNHEDAARASWMTVYKCMEMDSKQTMYERRLREVYKNRS